MWILKNICIVDFLFCAFLLFFTQCLHGRTQVTQFESTQLRMNELKKSFKDFNEKYKKKYSVDSDEGIKRFENFMANMKFITKRNGEDKKFKLAPNKFTDMTIEEIKEKILMKTDLLKEKFVKTSPSFLQMKNKNLMATHTKSQAVYDWTSTLGPAKDQGTCASCWAFASVGALEGNFAKIYGSKETLSPQELVDCDTENFGCIGGWLEGAYLYGSAYEIAREVNYAYQKTDGVCKKGIAKAIGVETYNSCYGCTWNEYAGFLSKGPIASVLDAASQDFIFYSSGVLSYANTSTCQINHAVIVTGYEVDYTTNLITLKIRNSWGLDWGMAGDAQISYTPENNSCGLTQYAFLPVPSIAQNCAVIYDSCNFTGKTLLRCEDDNNSNLLDIGFNKRIMSAKLGHATKLVAYSENNCQGNSVTISTDTSCIETPIASSFTLTSSIPPNDCVWIYEYCCYGGKKVEVCGNMVDATIIFNGKIGSVRFGKMITKFEMFSQTLFLGESVSLENESVCLQLSALSIKISIV